MISESLLKSPGNGPEEAWAHCVKFQFKYAFLGEPKNFISPDPNLLECPE